MDKGFPIKVRTLLEVYIRWVEERHMDIYTLNYQFPSSPRNACLTGQRQRLSETVGSW
jgi:hypothetical protein